MKILVTGGAGFIGGHVVSALLGAGHDVAVIDDLSTGKSANVPSGAQFHEVDIRDREAVDRVFDSFRPDIVDHHAAQASVSLSVREPIFDAEVNSIGTLNLIGAALRVGAERFVYASTGGAIYGEVPEGQRATTDWTPRPLSPYACSKYAGEVYLAYAHYMANHLDDDITPIGYTYTALVLLHDLYRNTDVPPDAPSILMNQSYAFYSHMIDKVPYIAEAVAPPEFSRGVMDALRT